jgi:UDP-3-O-[3-hydroxymyristoyl] N-acetylglucosamine deacetylase
MALAGPDIRKICNGSHLNRVQRSWKGVFSIGQQIENQTTHTISASPGSDKGISSPMNQDYLQKTIAKPASCSGVGLHSGKHANLIVWPAPENHGIKFRRIDLPDRPCIPARFNKVVDTSLATVIGSDGFIVSTIEHLMAALAGLGIDNALVDVDTRELPVMDGSAGPYVRMLKEAGIQCQSSPRCFFTINKPIELEEKEKFVGVYPADHFRISYTIEYDHPLIQTQSFSTVITADCFQDKIADARTFCLLHEVEQMQAHQDEFVRHKLLDCIGDFSLLGLPILGHIVARRSGHNFNRAFLEKFFLEKESWATRTMKADQSPSEPGILKQLAN